MSRSLVEAGGPGVTVDTSPTRQLGYASSLVKQYPTPESRRQLSFGQQTKILHLLDPAEQAALLPGIEAAKAEFWKKWIQFRCGLPGEGYPVFDDVVGMLPVRGQFVEFIDPQPGDLIVDLMGGSANMAELIARRQKDLAGYIVIDNNRHALDRAAGQLRAAGLVDTDIFQYDLSKGLPPHLSDRIDEIKPKRIRFISNWGISYLPADDFLHLAAQCFDTEITGSRSSTLDFNMITDGSFNPTVLAQRFQREIVPNALWHLRFKELGKARKATPLIQQFGRELTEVEPIWYPEEVQGLLQQEGFIVEGRNDKLLWGQSTAIKVGGKVRAA